MNKKAEIYEWGISGNGRELGRIDYKLRGGLSCSRHEYLENDFNRKKD